MVVTDRKETVWLHMSGFTEAKSTKLLDDHKAMVAPCGSHESCWLIEIESYRRLKDTEFKDWALKDFVLSPPAPPPPPPPPPEPKLKVEVKIGARVATNYANEMAKELSKIKDIPKTELIVLGGGVSRLVRSKKKDMCRVYLFGYPKGEQARGTIGFHYSQVIGGANYEFRSSYVSTSLPPTHTGIPKATGSGEVYAEIRPREVILLIAIHKNYTASLAHPKFTRTVLSKLILESMKLKWATFEKIIERQKIEGTVAAIQKMSETCFNQVKTRLNEAKSSHKAYRDSLIGTEKKMIELERTIAGFKEKKKTKEEIIKELQQLKRMPLVKDVRYTLHGIEIKTALLVIQKVPIGMFTIKVSGSEIMLLNDTPLDGIHHPHVNHGGSVCWGNAWGTVSRLMAEQNLLQLAMFLISFLETYTAGDTYLKLERWKERKLEPVTKEEKGDEDVPF